MNTAVYQLPIPSADAPQEDEPRIYSVTEVAIALGISRTGAYKKIDKHGLRNADGLYTLSEVLEIASSPKSNFHVTSERRIDALRRAFDQAGIAYKRNAKVPMLDLLAGGCDG